MISCSPLSPGWAAASHSGLLPRVTSLIDHGVMENYDLQSIWTSPGATRDTVNSCARSKWPKLSFPQDVHCDIIR